MGSGHAKARLPDTAWISGICTPGRSGGRLHLEQTHRAVPGLECKPREDLVLAVGLSGAPRLQGHTGHDARAGYRGHRHIRRHQLATPPNRGTRPSATAGEGNKRRSAPPATLPRIRLASCLRSSQRPFETPRGSAWGWGSGTSGSTRSVSSRTTPTTGPSRSTRCPPSTAAPPSPS